MGSIRPGEPMRARFAQVIEFEDGLIIRQRNYDCFDPF
jgi:ketosteroid isomerase-like protein